MKKIYGFLGAAALMMMTACSNEDLGEQNVPQTPQTKGDMYMSMTISPSGSIGDGTRTDTPNQGVEIGKDRENTVSTAMIIFVGEDSKVFKVIAPNATTLVPNDQDKTCAATFEVSRQDLLTNIGDQDSKSYDIYVIANPSDDMTSESTGIKAGQDIQRIFTLATDGNTYWSADHFLMSNSEKTTKTIAKTDIPEGTHTTAASALDLGLVKIQRAMSRFDLSTETANTEFTIVNGEADPTPGEQEPQPEPSQDLNDIKITFDGVALFNQATKANLFKVTSTNGETDPTEKTNLATEWATYKAAYETTISFAKEKVDNYVFSPIQTSYTLPLFDGAGNNETGLQGNANPREFTDFTYTPWSTIHAGEEDNTYTHPSTSTPGDLGAYRIWRYCMENTIYDKDNQKHGNTTGVIFRAKMTGTLLTGAKAVYSYNNVILGDARRLKNYATNQKSDKDDSGVYDIVKIRYNNAVMAAIEDNKNEPSQDSWTFEDGFKDVNGWKVDAEGKVVYPKFTDDEEEPAETDYYALLDTYLVEREFTIYRPDDSGNFYCYYTYYNRHNDNRKNTIMGPMEFATVRNNVYKLAVTGVYRLGHPGDPDDDPDPDDPGTPDEEDHLYLSVRCQILPWEVRINGIEF